MTPLVGHAVDGAVESGLRELTLSSEQVYAGRFLNVWRDQVQTPLGLLAQREHIKHPGAVVVVPLLDADTVVVEHQFRYPLQRVMCEFPAGKLDDAERQSPDLTLPKSHVGVWRCAVRELAEETGYTGAQWAYAGAMHNAIAYCDEIIHICFARGLHAGPSALDEGEHLQVGHASFDELQAAALRAELTDAKTITALWWWQQLRLGHWQPAWRELADVHAELDAAGLGLSANQP
jgi:ADP-ribose pyrophosphatase